MKAFLAKMNHNRLPKVRPAVGRPLQRMPFVRGGLFGPQEG
jgi:hypothetical protein